MTALSWIGSLWLALANIVGPFYGWFSVKVGYKWMLITALFLCTLSNMLSIISNQLIKILKKKKRSRLEKKKF